MGKAKLSWKDIEENDRYEIKQSFLKLCRDKYDNDLRILCAFLAGFVNLKYSWESDGEVRRAVFRKISVILKKPSNPTDLTNSSGSVSSREIATLISQLGRTHLQVGQIPREVIEVLVSRIGKLSDELNSVDIANIFHGYVRLMSYCFIII